LVIGYWSLEIYVILFSDFSTDFCLGNDNTVKIIF